MKRFWNERSKAFNIASIRSLRVDALLMKPKLNQLIVSRCATLNGWRGASRSKIIHKQEDTSELQIISLISIIFDFDLTSGSPPAGTGWKSVAHKKILGNIWI